MSTAPGGWLRGRSGLAAAVLLCAAGAALVLLVAGRTWAVRTQHRPAPLPDTHTAVTGADLVTWLPALGFVALAAAAALVAVRGRARTGLGGLLVVAGVAMAVAAGMAGVRSGGGPGWPVLASAGAVAVAVAGGLAAACSRDWPALGARYERRSGATRPAPGAPAAGPPAAGTRAAGTPAGREQRMWEALDRGEDPTA